MRRKVETKEWPKPYMLDENIVFKSIIEPKQLTPLGEPFPWLTPQQVKKPLKVINKIIMLV